MNSQALYSADEFTEEEYLDLLAKFTVKHHAVGIEQILTLPDESSHCSLIVDFSTLMEYHLPLSALLALYPEHILPLFDEAVVEVQRAIQAVPIEGLDERTIKENCHARISGVSLKPFKNVSLPRSSDVGSLISITGTIIRTGSLKLIEKQKEIICSKCKHQFTVRADLGSENNAFPILKNCPNISSGKCASILFHDVENSSIMANYQEIKIQEQIQSLGMGSIPRSIIVLLLDDLADQCQAGDDVTIVGIPMRKWRKMIPGARCNVQNFILANHIHVNNEREFNVHITEELTSEFTEFWEQFSSTPLQGRDTILHSVCPQIYGMYFVKLAFLLVLIGGKSQSSTGIRVRGESHLLMVGAPGTGKSQFLKFAAKLGQRSVMTSGTGSTSAGLTVTAVKDKGGEWILEAGALVLADGGVCCIDEFNCIKEQDRATIHEAMEQQTLSVAKAGLVCKLNSRTTIIAACNPKGSMDEVDDMSINLGIASPLLSRFDLVLLLQDNNDTKWDEQVSSFILSGIISEDTNVWSVEQLKSYIAFIKATITPVLSADASKVLITYYKQQRSTDGRNQARTTIRLLESMVRLTEAHARLMFRSEANVMDAIFTITLVECSMLCSALSGVPSALHSYFPTDPDQWFATQQLKILTKLNLQGLAHLGHKKSPPSSQSPNYADHPAPDPCLAPTSQEILSPTSTMPHMAEGIIAETLSDTGNPGNVVRNAIPSSGNVVATPRNVWAIYTQQEPEEVSEEIHDILEDRNPIDMAKAKGLERKLAEQFEERRKEKEKEIRQATIDWENYDFTDDISDSEMLEFSASFPDIEPQVEPVVAVGEKRGTLETIDLASSNDGSSNSFPSPSPLKVQKVRESDTPAIRDEEVFGIHASPHHTPVILTQDPSCSIPTNSQLSSTLASLRIQNHKKFSVGRKKFVD